jgi:hypothetical protein
LFSIIHHNFKKGEEMRIIKQVSIGTLLLVSVALTTSQATENNNIGIGYNGMYVGNFIQGVSVRGWKDKIGLEATVGSLSVGGNRLTLTNIKAMYALVNHTNSKFYVGLGGGYIKAVDQNGYSIRPFFGAEYRFTEMKELGFNWEVGWMHSSVGSGNFDIDGTSVSIGIHYYF